MPSSVRLFIAFSVALLVAAGGPLAGGAGAGEARNLFSNPSFEEGRGEYRMDKGGGTEAGFTVDTDGGADGPRCARVTVGSAREYGVQFGQIVEAGQKGRTYTFAVLAKSTKGPVTVQLEIERSAKPWDRAVRSERFTITNEKWAELHTTFQVAKDFPEGWFAYVSSNQPNCEFQVDLFRLYEGDYVPYEKAAREEALAVGVGLFDTGAPSPTPLPGDAVAKKAGWTKVPAGDTAYKFKGDAVLANDRLAAVFRARGAGIELYSNGPEGFAPRAVLAPAGSGPRLARVDIAKNTPAAGVLDADFKAADGKSLGLRVELKMGQVFLKTEPRGATAALRVEAACRYVVMPDFFADDIIADATELPGDRGELPSENFLLHLLGNGNALVMTVATAREKDAQIALDGQGAERRIRASEIDYGKDGKVFVALLEGPDVWHKHEVAKDDADKVVRLNWRAPFPAQWRMDWRRADHKLTDSWEMIAQRKGGDFERHSIFGEAATIPANRQRWTTVLGSFRYPCWLDPSGQGFIQPLRGAVRFQGPALIYPVSRVRATPLSVFTVADIARGTLGVGPCEYILDVEAQGARYMGRATCATRDALRGIYSRKEQKRKKAEIEKILQDVMAFVRHIRGRVEAYLDFAHQTIASLDEQKKAHPELAGFCDEMATLARSMDAYFEKRRAEIRTPDYVQGLTDKFRKELMDNEGPDALEKCREITAAIVVVGGSQDELVGECRMVARLLRQRAGLAMAADPRVGGLAREIRRRAQLVLRNPAGHEAPRH